MLRRRFLESLGALGVSVYAAPAATNIAGGNAAENSDPRANRSANIAAAEPALDAARSLVLIELQGGNDGLNTVVPYRDPLYRQLRPTLALSQDACLALDDALGLHPALEPLMPWWQRGELAVVNGVGYPNPNRSHFRSIDIWETASDADETLVDGWLRSVVTALPAQGTGIKGVAIDGDIGPFAGSTLDSVVMTDLQRFIRQARQLPTMQGPTINENPAFAHLVAVEQTTRRAAAAFERSLARLEAADKPASGKVPAMVTKLDTVASLIELDLGPRIFKVTLGGFDTHVNQAVQHHTLMDHLARGLATFAERMRRSGRWSDTLVMTYSEFGRRVAENGSAGTDHGTAAPHLLMGGRVKGGLHGAPPDLAMLDDDNLRFDIDFRQLYSAAMLDWLEVSTTGTPLEEFSPYPIFT